MKYVRVNPLVAAAQIADAINEKLKDGSVLWLVSGGSNINLAVEIKRKLIPADKLTIGLIDERYGPIGHADSNWTQLLAAGLNTADIKTLPILRDASIAQTTQQYAEEFNKALQDHTSVIGLFGMGSDGHTAGILPNSPAVDSHELVTSYEAEDFERITVTPAAIKLFNIAFLVAYGENKRPVLERLKEEASIAQQPAQALKQIDLLIIYNDQIGEQE